MLRAVVLFGLYLYHRVCWCRRVTFHGFAVILPMKGSTIRVGAGTSLNSGPLSNLLGLPQRVIIVARDGGVVEIGDRVGISGSTVYSIVRIRIGDDTIVGAGCKIIDNDFHPLESEARKRDDRGRIRRAPIDIGRDVFVGAGSIVLRGTVIGDRCVVGAGSVVKGVFPADVVIAGNPARIVRRLRPGADEAIRQNG